MSPLLACILYTSWQNSQSASKVKSKYHLIKYKFVPILIHGDGVEFVDGDSLESLQLAPLLGTGKSLDSMFLMATWPYSVTHKVKKTMSELKTQAGCQF